MTTFRFRHILILIAIAIALNIFNITSWILGRNELTEVASVKLLQDHDKEGGEPSIDIIEDEVELPKSQNYTNAENSFRKKEYQASINELNVAIEKHMDVARSYFLLGRIYEVATFPDGKYLSKMASNYEKYIELKSNGHKVEHAKLKTAQYYISLGLMNQNTEILDVAEKYLKSINQDNNEVRMALGAIYLDRNNYKQAIAEFEKSANLHANELKLKYNSLGLAYIKTERYGNAENVLKIAIQLEPDNKFAHNNLGYIYIRLLKFKEARAQFIEALRVDPQYKNAKDNLEWLNATHP